MKKVLFIIVYWILNLTWGSIMTVIGTLAAIISILIGGTPHKNGCTMIIEIGGNWGGVNLGVISLCGRYSTLHNSYYESTRRHEFGHSVQNMILGPLFPLLVAIPSAIRYWYHRINLNKGVKFDDNWYDSVWFEGTATKIGTKLVNFIEK